MNAMFSARMDKWTAFLCSLAVPGVGQLLVGSWTSVGWLAAAVAWFWCCQTNGIAPPLQFIAFVALGLCSAEHAKRLLELPSARSESAARVRTKASRKTIRSRVLLAAPRGRSVSISLELELPRRSDDVWKQVADLPHFLTIDPFHERVVLMRPTPRAGVDVVLAHNSIGIRFLRFGRILRWREGEEYAFSDLSRRGRQRGFPHVFFVRVERLSAGRSRLTICVRGKWTSRWIPICIARLWLKFVFREHARLLRKAI